MIKKKGFTLIELIVVIAVLGILVLLAAPKILGYTEKARIAHITNDIKAYEVAIEAERVNDDNYIAGWAAVSVEDLENFRDSESLYDKRGYVKKDYQFEDEYFEVEGNLVNTKLTGNFIISDGGKVYYVENLDIAEDSNDESIFPLEVSKNRLALGSLHKAGIDSDGSIMIWGDWDYESQFGPMGEIPEGNDFVSISAESGHTIALRENGSIVTFGADSYFGGMVEGMINDTPTDSDFVAIEAGMFYNIALKEDGSIVSWGNTNFPEEMLNDLEVSFESPSGKDFVSISSGVSRFGITHSVALKSDGSLVSWGAFETEDPSSEVPFVNLPQVPAGNDFKAVSAGPNYNVAIRNDGSLVSWGINNDYDLMNVPPGNDYVAVSVGDTHGLALKEDGSLVAWGQNGHFMEDLPSNNGYLEILANHGVGMVIDKDGDIIDWPFNRQ